MDGVGSAKILRYHKMQSVEFNSDFLSKLQVWSLAAH